MALAAIALLAGCSKPPPSYITVGDDLAAAAHLEGEEHAGVSIVKVDSELELADIAHIAHEQFHRCGGFLYHASLADARGALESPPPPRAIGYSLDRDEAVRTVVGALDKTKLLDMIRKLSAMPTRYYRSEGGANASTWLQSTWQEIAKTRPDITVDLVDHGWPQQSVILTIPGTTRKSEIVVIGGHLDSISMRGGDAPGADDDASGIATITEVLRALVAADYRPGRTIQIMAYAAEEVGLRGSQEIVRDYKARKLDVVGALQLDMTNYQGSDKDIWLMKDFTNPAQNDFVVKLIEAYTGATWGLDACGYGCSDHASWYRGGVPASMPFESRFRDSNKRIHTKGDTLEASNNNADHAIKFARLGAAYVIEMGKGGLGGTKIASRDDRR